MQVPQASRAQDCDVDAARFLHRRWLVKTQTLDNSQCPLGARGLRCCREVADSAAAAKPPESPQAWKTHPGGAVPRKTFRIAQLLHLRASLDVLTQETQGLRRDAASEHSVARAGVCLRRLACQRLLHGPEQP